MRRREGGVGRLSDGVDGQVGGGGAGVLGEGCKWVCMGRTGCVRVDGREDTGGFRWRILVCWLADCLTSPQHKNCTSETDLLRQLYVLPH